MASNLSSDGRAIKLIEGRGPARSAAAAGVIVTAGRDINIVVLLSNCRPERLPRVRRYGNGLYI